MLPCRATYLLQAVRTTCLSRSLDTHLSVLFSSNPILCTRLAKLGRLWGETDSENAQRRPHSTKKANVLTASRTEASIHNRIATQTGSGVGFGPQTSTRESQPSHSLGSQEVSVPVVCGRNPSGREEGVALVSPGAAPQLGVANLWAGTFPLLPPCLNSARSFRRPGPLRKCVSAMFLFQVLVTADARRVESAAGSA